jgi:type II secretory pathway pseudopilin PulG
MLYKNEKNRLCIEHRASCKALTILEIVIALAIITIIFAAVLPQFRVILKGWDTRQANAEVLQNGRVLIDHISRNLSKAIAITAVSESSDPIGFIEFLDNDNNNCRYDINSTSHYVEFGINSNLSDLAGPVSSLTFTCYDACDLDNALLPVTDVNIIRTVRVDAAITNSGSPAQDKTFTAWTYLRTNDESSDCDLVGWWKLDETSGLNAEDSSGQGNDGTLNYMNGDEWTAGQISGALAFDGTNDYVDLGTDSSLNFGSSEPFTVAAWVKTTEDYGMILSFRSSTDDGSVIDMAVGYEGGANDPGKAMILVRQNGGSGGYANVKGGSVNDGLWHHMAAIRGSGSTIELFLDGVSQGTDSGAESAGAITTDWRAIGSERRWVNVGFGTADQRYLDGTVDDVRIYNRALEPNEIAQLAETLEYEDFYGAKVSSDDTSITITTPGIIDSVITLGSWVTGLNHEKETGTDRALVFLVHTRGSSRTATGASYGGQSMTKVVDRMGSSGGTRAYVAAFILNDAGIDAASDTTFVPSWSGTAPTNVEYSSVFLGDVNQAALTGATARATGTGSTVSTSPLATDDGDMVIIAAACNIAGEYTVNYGFTEALEFSVGSGDGVDGNKIATGVNETPSVTHDVASRQSLIGFVVQANEPEDIEGDLLIAAVATDGDTSSSLAPFFVDDWNEIDVNNNGSDVTLGVWYRFANDSESTSHEFTWTGGEQAYGWIMRFAGQDSVNPINTYSARGRTSSNPTSPAVNTTVDNCLILRLGAFDNDYITVDDPGLHSPIDHTSITMDKSGGSSTNTLFQDDFESGFSKWSNSNPLPTDWSQVATPVPPPNPGSYSACADSSSDDLISDNINMSGYDYFTIDLWYRDHLVDNGDNVYLQFYDGNNYDNEFELGNTSPEDTWHNYNATIYNSGADAQYFNTNFRIKFEATSIDSGEYLWIDDIVITVPVNEMVSGGAGYIKQASAGNSGESDFALTESSDSQMLTIAIAPVPQDSGCTGSIYP